jgi:uncharacterized protein YbaR (Trm112 family)
MTDKAKQFSPDMKCGHCANRAPMERVATYSGVKEHTANDGAWGINWSAGPIYEMLVCPACEGVTLTKFNFNDVDPEEIDNEVLYPIDDSLPAGLPSSVAKAYEAARLVRNIDANAFGVLLGRVLELVCHDRSASGRSLSEQLHDLAAKGEIPAKLVEVANGLRGMRNIGAHPSLGELTQAEVPILDDLARAILEYVYSAPLLAQKAAERMAKLKAS